MFDCSKEFYYRLLTPLDVSSWVAPWPCRINREENSSCTYGTGDVFALESAGYFGEEKPFASVGNPSSIPLTSSTYPRPTRHTTFTRESLQCHRKESNPQQASGRRPNPHIMLAPGKVTYDLGPINMKIFKMPKILP